MVGVRRRAAAAASSSSTLVYLYICNFHIIELGCQPINRFCLGPGCYVDTKFQKNAFLKKLDYDFGVT